MDFIDGLGMGFDLIWSILSADPALTWFLILFFGGLTLLAFIVRLLRESKLRQSGIYEVDKMSGRKFEDYLKVLLSSRGYNVTLTPASGDYGADLILSSKDKRIIVQAKRFKKKVGIKAVQEIASAKSYYNADECWVITNNFFTPNAIKLATSNRVKLIDRNELISWMSKYNKSA